jgi:hypothetical protein
VECYTSHSLIYLTCHVILHRSIAVLFCILMLLLLQRLCRNCNGFVVPHFPQFSVYEVYTDVPYNILMQGILLTPLIWCRSHLWYTVKRLILKHVTSKYFHNILPVWVHLYTSSRNFDYVAIVWVGSPLFPLYLRMGAGLALKTLLIFSLGRWTVSRISLTTVQS